MRPWSRRESKRWKGRAPSGSRVRKARAAPGPMELGRPGRREGGGRAEVRPPQARGAARVSGPGSCLLEPRGEKDRLSLRRHELGDELFSRARVLSCFQPGDGVVGDDVLSIRYRDTVHLAAGDDVADVDD